MNKYLCAYCGKVVERDSDKAWIKSYCSATGKDVRLIIIKPINQNMMMYDWKDVSNEGKHDFIRSQYEDSRWARTISTGIFKWQLKASGKYLKRSAVIVRVKGSRENLDKIYEKAREICLQLDAGTYQITRKIVIV